MMTMTIAAMKMSPYPLTTQDRNFNNNLAHAPQQQQQQHAAAADPLRKQWQW